MPVNIPGKDDQNGGFDSGISAIFFTPIQFVCVLLLSAFY
jgi:hypothetical protein